MMILYIVGAVIAYIGIGGIAAALFNDEALVAFWPLTLIISIFLGIPYLILRGYNSIIKYWKNRNKPVDPEDIVRGVVATAVLRYPERWDSNVWTYKNIKITIRSQTDPFGKDDGYYCTARVSGTDLGYCEKLKAAIAKSYEIAKVQKEAKEKAERAQKMLDGLEEFMQ